MSQTDNSKTDKNQKTTFKAVKGEFEKIVWPSREELKKQTITVIFTSLLLGAVIVGYDIVFSYLMSFVG